MVNGYNYMDYLIGLFGGFPKIGVPNSWMVFVRENPNWMTGGYPCVRKPPYFYIQSQYGMYKYV